MSSSEIIYQVGLPEHFETEAVGLYDEAFGEKFSVAVRSHKDRILLLNKCLMRDYAIIAVSGQRLIGIAGFHTANGSLTGGMTYRGLLLQLGFVKGNWAALIFGLYDRQPKPGELLMDGIAVQADARGMGVGGRLLDEITKYAKEHAFNRIRLDVIDTNTKAKKLYEQKGFQTMKTVSFPYLRWLLGFGGSTTMELKLNE